jgi:aquaporin related protein
MVITGTLPWVRGILLLPAQILGGIVAAALVRCMFPGPLVVNTILANDVTPAQGVFIEMFLTSLLVFTNLMLAAEKHYGTFMAPVGIGIALFVAMIAGMSLVVSYIFILYITRYKIMLSISLKACTTQGPH